MRRGLADSVADLHRNFGLLWWALGDLEKAEAACAETWAAARRTNPIRGVVALLRLGGKRQRRGPGLAEGVTGDNDQRTDQER